jgi:anti-anti-sigma regulatory factor
MDEIKLKTKNSHFTTYIPEGNLFFVSSKKFRNFFIAQEDENNIIIDMSKLKIIDLTGVSSLCEIVDRFLVDGKHVQIVNIDEEKLKLINNSFDIEVLLKVIKMSKIKNGSYIIRYNQSTKPHSKPFVIEYFINKFQNKKTFNFINRYIDEYLLNIRNSIQIGKVEYDNDLNYNFVSWFNIDNFDFSSLSNGKNNGEFKEDNNNIFIYGINDLRENDQKYIKLLLQNNNLNSLLILD